MVDAVVTSVLALSIRCSDLERLLLPQPALHGFRAHRLSFDALLCQYRFGGAPRVSLRLSHSPSRQCDRMTGTIRTCHTSSDLGVDLPPRVGGNPFFRKFDPLVDRNTIARETLSREAGSGAIIRGGTGTNPWPTMASCFMLELRIC